MLQLLSKRAALALFAFPAIILAGCSDSFGTVPSPSTFKASAAGYEKTLTPEQQKAVIADLRGEQAKRGETPQDARPR